ncbi:hypothetical protein BP00DRAFT_478304 [Aspergillus indologenus CBS 114.80]|uniref:Uncharacterized protein n=1 Tax=Aspergillus indologenus CBS 114.80 TaxID=1450541 RepID=A0A2V5HZH2_9EURO|nr:hypothetical protein BP00DRAFT_478304 [Aspergillus indologenus CBS 114.80]
MPIEYDHEVYNVRGSPRVGQKKHRLYLVEGLRAEALYDITDQICDGYYWFRAQSLHNTSHGEAEMETSYTTGLKVTKGESLTETWGVGAAYSGLSFDIGGSRTTFTSEETETSETHSVRVTVPPQTTTFLYQRVFRFKTRLWFLNDAWNELIRVGGWCNTTPVCVDGDVEIYSNDYFPSDVELTGAGTVVAEETRDPVEFTTTKPINECSPGCQYYLPEKGVEIPGDPYCMWQP